ncbi:MAG: hypothetical protein N2438_13380 [Limisphaera sp.]|nr:hypothetical protein [Limisphaera sp.]
MSGVVNALIGVVMGLNLWALGTSRLPTLIGVVSLQGTLLGALPWLMEPGADWRLSAVALATVVVKGWVIPLLLRRAMRAAHVDREVEPFLGFVPSLLLGAGGTVAALVLAGAMPVLEEHHGSLLVPGSLASLFTGLVLLMGRSKAMAQVCGYLILENGIYLFGLLLIRSMPLLVEAGILLDVTVGVFILGIVVDRIQRAFDSLDTRKLTVLRE